ncbi:hypothetical protein B0A49_05758 [Cryomyces minteri]|uniref:G-patch domain-containing protein n=1 Tax=Cryomyces minteri TaxID=331657 RepID=A0A4U0XI53_9PEZI|nr:hypothetical protein B0A49_05758 [Cryomyces minteri]
MDASAYLQRHGWRGSGHSLDRTGNGLKKPLLISKKVDVLGVGIKKHDVSDQWWMRAFDNSLKELGSGQKSTLQQVREGGVKKGGLYGFFIMGQGVPGTLSEDTTSTTTPAASTPRAMSPVTNGIDGTSAPAEAPHASKKLDVSTVATEAPAERSKKRKREGESREELRKRRKEEKAEKARAGAARNREKALADGTLDLTAEAEKAKARELDRKASQFVTKTVLEGRLEEVAAAARREDQFRAGIEPSSGQPNSQMNEDRLKMINGAGPVTQTGTEPLGPPRKLSYKAEKYARERLKREAKRAEKARLLALETGEPMPTELTTEERKSKHKAAKAERKAARKEANAARQKKGAAKLAAKIARREAKLQRKAVKRQEKAEFAERLRAEKKAQEPSEPISDEVMDTAPDEIKFGMTKKGRVKKVPGVGHVDRYPTKAEKRATKNAAQALRRGITVEELLAEQQKEREQKEVEAPQKANERRAAKATDEHQDSENAAPATTTSRPLSEEKRVKYAARAAEKGMTIEAYIARREAKKANHGEAREPAAALESAGFMIDTQGDANLASGAPADASAGFVVDTRGDESIWEVLKSTDAVKTPIRAPVDPAVWKAKKVKDLTREERKARQAWMREQCALKAAKRAGGVSMSKKERAKKRADKKMEVQKRLTQQVLGESGARDGGKELTKEQLNDARRKARKLMRAAKKETKRGAGKRELAGRDWLSFAGRSEGGRNL